MQSLALLRTVVRELTTRERSERVNEPDLVMDDHDKVVAFFHAGREQGVMAPIYYQYADRQPELFTLDHFNLPRAAFAKEEFCILHDRYLKRRASLYSMFLIPVKIIIKSPAQVRLSRHKFIA